jgi:hypothetical protein
MSECADIMVCPISERADIRVSRMSEFADIRVGPMSECADGPALLFGHFQMVCSTLR